MFRSFYLAGFECATGYNMHGEWIDQIAATQHDHHVDEDYARLAEVDIHAVREAIRWPLVDRAGRYDFSSVQSFVSAALHHDFDVIWDLFHYGYPDDLDPFSPMFVDRFAAYCRACAGFICEQMDGVCYFTPINEPSYLSWAAGEAGLFAPHARGRGFELKVALARAAIAGIDAIREVCPDARIVNVDPICRVVAAGAGAEEQRHVQHFNDDCVFQFWDMMAGRMLPEMGGSPEHLDIVGVNYYWTNQWELGREGVPLADSDPRRVPLRELVRTVSDRYGAEIVITETSALGEARGPWVHELSAMAEQLLDEGVRLGGVCLYPILGMPEWHERDQWTNMGLWDLEDRQEVLHRKVCEPMLRALRVAQSRARTRSLGRERTFALQQTGDVTLLTHGMLLWHVIAASGAYQINLIRSDQPCRLWCASIAVHGPRTTVHHVVRAAEWRVLLELLRHTTPPKILAAHGMKWPRLVDAVESWHLHVDGLAGLLPELERAPRSQAKRAVSAASAGGRP